MSNDTNHLQCFTCDWRGDDPTSRVESEAFEFWGHRGNHDVYVLTCPDCGEDVFEGAICAECREHPADAQGTDFCRACLAKVQQEEMNDQAAAARERHRQLIAALVDITRSAA